MNPETYTIEESEDRISLSLKGDLTVSIAKNLSVLLHDLVQRDQHVDVRLKGIEAIDVAGVQLMYAFKNELKQRNKQVNISWPTNLAMMELMAQTGMYSIFRKA